jgi:class 3 adenylate cyclase/tetratricopeptide (TPR) repeat protein
MRCLNCGHNGPEESQFCEACGTPLSVTCRACGRGNTPSARFCIRCGVALVPEGAPAVAPGGLIPRHLRERILSSRHVLAGERKRVTVLFADIKGSTERIERMDPEEAAVWLERVLTTMIDAVHSYEGIVNQVHGDGIMALFGAPLAQEDHALRGCHAAIAVQQAVKALPSGEFEVRVGLHSGEVVVRSISDDLSMHYDAVGVTAHLAHRMEQMAPPGTIRMTRETYRLVEEFVIAEPLGPVTVKGLQEAVEALELVAMRPGRTRWQARAARKLTRFVGREAEAASLAAALARVRAGRGEMIAVVGDPGTGKSRLVHEFLQSPELEGAATFETGAATYGKNSPYLAVATLLRAGFGIGERDTTEEIAQKLRDRFSTADEKLCGLLPVLHALLDLDLDPAWQELDPLQRRRRIVDAVKLLLVKAAEDNALLVGVVEDLQWIDAESHAVLDALAEIVPKSRVLLLVTYRSEYANPWIAKGLCRTVKLDPLSETLGQRLLHFLLGDRIGIEQIKRLLIERSGGNPLFIEESVNALVETAALEGTPGDYRPTKDIRQISVPATVQAVLAARVDRLEPGPRSVLDVASVIGRNVPLALLRAVVELPEERLRAFLTELQAADFLYETPSGEDYVFKHALTRDVAYESLLIEARRALHGRIVGKLEQIYDGRLEEQVDNLAEHAYQAGVWAVAVKYLLRACIRAARSAPRAAVALFARGLVALDHLPESALRAKAAIDLRLVVLNALIPLGDHAHSLQLLTDAESLARALGDQRRLGLVYGGLTVLFWITGKHDRALEAGELALAAANAQGHRPSQMGARFSLGMVHHALGNLSRTIEIQRDLLKDFSPEMERERFGWVGYPSVLIRTFLAGALIDSGDFAEAETHLEAACRVADELGHAYSRAMIYAIVGQLAIERGTHDHAADILEPVLALCREEEVWTMYPVIAARLGLAYTRAGRTAEALATLERALEPSVYRKGATYTWLYLYLAAAEAYLTAGRGAEARLHVDKAEALARGNNEQAHLAVALKLRGDILRASADGGESDRARQSYLDAIALAEARGMRPLLAQCHRALGELLAKQDRPAANQHLTRVEELVRQLGIAGAALSSD